MNRVKEFIIYIYLFLFKMLPACMVLLSYDHILADFLVDSIRTNKYKTDSIYVLHKTNLGV
jgi:hypothetical protein